MCIGGMRLLAAGGMYCEFGDNPVIGILLGCCAAGPLGRIGSTSMVVLRVLLGTLCSGMFSALFKMALFWLEAGSGSAGCPAITSILTVHAQIWLILFKMAEKAGLCLTAFTAQLC